MDCFVLVALISAILWLLLQLAKWRYAFWKRNGVVQLNPELFYGDLRQMLTGRVSMGGTFASIYSTFKSRKLPFGGVYWAFRPEFVPVDPQLIKNMLIKDFAHFHDRGVYHHQNDVLTQNLFRLDGEPWRVLRQKLSPTFTSSRMKMMFDTVHQKMEQLEHVLERSIQEGALNVSDLCARYTTDVIGSCAFGIECNSLEDPQCDLRHYSKKISRPMPLKQWAENTIPSRLLGYTGFKSFPELEDFFRAMVMDTIQYREKNAFYRKDFMHLLLQLRNKGVLTDDGNIAKERAETGILTDNEIIAQCFIFFTAGFDTSSATMTYALRELALQPALQDRVREEIRQVSSKYGGKITYEATKDLVLTGKVIAETLRKYPVLPTIPRICTRDYPIPNSNVVLKKGTHIQIPVWGIHMDPEYYPNPEEFDPERFSDEGKGTRPEFTYFPFGEGPRICIGMRFAQMQSRLGLAGMLKTARFSALPGTSTPLTFKPSMILLHACEEICLKVEKA